MLKKWLSSVLLAALLLSSFLTPAWAKTIDSRNSNLPVDRVEEAADKVVRESEKERANDIYFKGSEEGAKIIDKARENARIKLKILADKAEKEPNSSLSDSEKSFLTKFDTADDR